MSVTSDRVARQLAQPVDPLVLLWFTSDDAHVRHDGKRPADSAHTCVCGMCGATYVSDGASDGPEDLFTHMVRKHVTIAVLAAGQDIVIRRVEQP